MSTAVVTGHHFIAGRWLPGRGDAFESRSPAHTNHVVGVFPASTAEETLQAVAAARAAYPGWRRTSRIRRAELFDNLAQIVKRETDNLARLMARSAARSSPSAGPRSSKACT